MFEIMIDNMLYSHYRRLTIVQVQTLNAMSFCKEWWGGLGHRTGGFGHGLEVLGIISDSVGLVSRSND